jgi:hypothetical protein
MPVPLKKARGQPGRMIGFNTSCRVAILGAVSGTGQALQGDTFPDDAWQTTPSVQVPPHLIFPWEKKRCLSKQQINDQVISFYLLKKNFVAIFFV